MDAHAFLQAQQWLIPVTAPTQHDPHDQGLLVCKTRFHLCFEEQHTPGYTIPRTGSWAGFAVKDAVSIRLQKPVASGSGECASMLDARVAVLQLQEATAGGQDPHQQGPEGVLHITWYGQQYRLNRQHLVKVVCSAAVAAAAAAAGCDRHGPSCLLAAPVQASDVKWQGVEWISLITKHVCMNIMAPTTAAPQLGRVLSALHQSAPCSTASTAAAAATPPNSSTLTQPSSQLQPPPADIPQRNLPADVAACLSAAGCEVQMMQLLLSSQQAGSGKSSGGAAAEHGSTTRNAVAAQDRQEQHLLNAVAHLHASQQAR